MRHPSLGKTKLRETDIPVRSASAAADVACRTWAYIYYYEAIRLPLHDHGDFSLAKALMALNSAASAVRHHSNIAISVLHRIMPADSMRRKAVS